MPTFNQPPRGVVLSHVAPSGATHSNAFHTIRSCFVNCQRLTDNVTVKLEVYNSKPDFDAGNPKIDDVNYTFTLVVNTVKGNTVTKGDDILTQAYNHLWTLNAPDGTTTNYSGQKNPNTSGSYGDSLPDTDKKS